MLSCCCSTQRTKHKSLTSGLMLLGGFSIEECEIGPSSKVNADVQAENENLNKALKIIFYFLAFVFPASAELKSIHEW